MDNFKIGRFIAECRKDKQYTQAQLAEKLGITDKAVSKWECGKSMPDSAICEFLCEELGISMSELFAGEKLDEEAEKRVMDQSALEIIKLYEKFKYYKDIFIGVVIILVGSLIYTGMDSTSVVARFMEGVTLGLSVGIKIIGVIWIIYGYAKVTRIK